MAVEHIDYSKIEFADLAEDQDELKVIDGITSDSQFTPADVENLLRMKDQVKEFQILMMKYDCALSEVRTKLDVLNKELSLINNRNPFESIKMRIKTPLSIYKKLSSKGIDFTIENINDNLSDIAGIRVICSFVDDIYMLAKCLSDQDDITVLQRKDYIEHPKKSGYRSLHLIIEIIQLGFVISTLQKLKILLKLSRNKRAVKQETIVLFIRLVEIHIKNILTKLI